MPLYEYRCSKCRKVFEVLQKFSDKPLKKHQGCGGSVERLVSTSSFQLKGGGWYAEGYAKKAPAAESKADSGGESKSAGESKSESKSETKTESKSESKPSKSDSKASDSKPAKTKA